MRKKEPITWKAYLECQCSSKEHLFVLEYDEDLGMIISQQAHQWQGFFRRCRQALKYVFGKQCMGWDTSMLRSEDLPKVKEWLNLAERHGLGVDLVDDLEKK